MKNMKTVVFFLGCLVFLGITHVATADPFSDDQIVIPPQTIVQPTAITSPGVPVASQTLLGTDTQTLWGQLHRLYKESDAGRIGKRVARVSKKTPTEHHLTGFDDLKIKINGDNYCGQFAMSTLLNGMGIKTDPQAVYQKTNPAGIFTAPPTIVENLRMSGIDASMKNKASVSDITKRIDQGKPVMVLVDSGDGTPHWICITGYDTDPKGQITSLRMRDSYWGVDGPHTMAIADFEKAWKKPFGKGPLGDLLSYSNLLIDNNGKIDPSKSPPLYPGSFSTATEDNLAGGINDVVTGYKNGKIAQVTGGVAKLLLGLPGAISGAASNFLGSKSEGWTNWGKEKWQQGGVGNKILGGAAIVGGNLATGVSKAGKVVSDVWSSGATIIGNGIKKLGSLFS